jgi:2-methylisocitrate lyase-like PEP mutase family enzyme
MTPTQTPARTAFRALHTAGCFIIPNPWDIGTARYLRHLGFKALATTSSGFSFSRGLSDGEAGASREAALAHFAEIVSATELPVNADYQSGYAPRTEDLAESVSLCVATGVAGLSIEDATGDSSRPLYELPQAVERIIAAREAIGSSGADVLLTARAECYLVGHPRPLEESLRRLEAYARAGADVLYAPGASSRGDIKAVVTAVAPKPVNVLAGSNFGLALSDLAELGVRRISVGSALARAAWTGFIRAAAMMAEAGSFAGLDNLTPYAELDRFFREDAKARLSRV